jgi:hypothetical protein
MNDQHGLYIVDEMPVITSVEPIEGAEGTIATLKGSGFSRYVRNNCVVVANLGACARAQEGSTSTELKVRIDPVAKKKVPNRCFRYAPEAPEHMVRCDESVTKQAWRLANGSCK